MEVFEAREDVAGVQGATLLDGTATARTIRSEIADRVRVFTSQHGTAPHLAAVLIGADPASETYVAMKQKACGWVGMGSSVHRLGTDATQQQAEELVARLNSDTTVSGSLVQ